MALTTRPLTMDDFDQTLRLGREAFGTPPPGTPAPSRDDWPGAGRHNFGTFDGDQLVGRIMGRDYHSWYGGREVPTTGIAGVTIVGERRGEGLLDDLFHAVLEHGRTAGQVVSTLFPTAPGIYRRYGYELISSYDTVEVPVAALSQVKPVEGITLRRAGAADFDALRHVYDVWAAAQNGPLTRRGISFPATGEDLVSAFSGVTLALDESGETVGYALWDRGTGYGASAAIEVGDLLATDPRGYAALWRFLGGFATVTGQIRLKTSGADPARLFLPSAAWKVVGQHPYMLRVDDVVGAFEALSLTSPAELSVPFSVAGDLLGLDGGYRLTVGSGSSCERVSGGHSGPVFSPRGLALAWSGAQNTANLRLTGHLTGPTSYDATLDLLLAGRPLHIRDYF